MVINAQTFLFDSEILALVQVNEVDWAAELKF
jgi:hypothetical protein